MAVPIGSNEESGSNYYNRRDVGFGFEALNTYTIQIIPYVVTTEYVQ